MVHKDYEHTIQSGFICFCIQALVINFIPLLFITFQQEFSLSITQITFLITINFVFQLLTDLMAMYYIKTFGIRGSVLIAHAVVIVGFMSISLLPSILSNAYVALLVGVICMAIGAGLIEVLISPIIEACPSNHKSATMSLLHSFFCWGSVVVIIGSSLFFYVFGIENWRILALLWTLVPFFNGIYFSMVPLVPIENPEHHVSTLFSSKLFWILLVIMICAGASEQVMCQWTSTFVESSLGLSKEIGDIVGPCSFVFAMGLARIYYSKNCETIHLTSFMLRSGILSTICYIIAGMTNNPFIALLACLLCGFSVGILWPGALSIASLKMDHVSPSMFAFLAVAGDIGCLSGPTITGIVYHVTGHLKDGFLFASIFPVILCIAVICSKKYHNVHTG